MPTKSKRGCRGRGSHTSWMAETWLSGPQAVELGFADDLLFTAKEDPAPRTGELCVLEASGDKPAAEQAAPYEKRTETTCRAAVPAA